MSKYIKLEDAIEQVKTEFYGGGYQEWLEISIDNLINRIANLQTIEVNEEDELKFYYVDSIDDYWIGRRLDHFYYAEWEDRLGFVWSKSRYLPWGEHVVAPDTLWKEHTYPSEPREIPFTEWIVGFMKKYGSKVSEDCISREDLRRSLTRPLENNNADEMYWKGWHDCTVAVETRIADAPSVIPKAKGGEWIPCSERLPDATGFYLCTVNRDAPNVRTMKFELLVGDEYRWLLMNGTKVFPRFVLAWMPLPPAYEGE